MGIVGDRRRRRHRTFVLAAGLAVLVSLVAVGGRDPSPPPPLPDLPPAGRDDVTLAIDAERDGGGVSVEVELAVDVGGRPLSVRAWDDDSVVGERLAEGQVVIHLGLAGIAPPDLPDDVFTYRAPQPPAPLLVRPGRTLAAEAAFDGSGPELDGRTPADGDDVGRLDEVRVCVWSERESRAGGDHPAVCADDDL